MFMFLFKKAHLQYKIAKELIFAFQAICYF